jgi:hypothetical protein
MRPRSATEEAVELGKSEMTDVLIMQYASLITEAPQAPRLRPCRSSRHFTPPSQLFVIGGYARGTRSTRSSSAIWRAARCPIPMR